ncbi:Uncharacterised protein [Pannonibacter phragmitetus]|uniref:Uncharacterized protein n=1 Tax=Pannonibacter phragmitetus TaxID=121719 RepID=A0A379HJV4_9HYPH|nr:Uncharacterised protein [Pannonibacter phragmitetus]
MQTRVQVIQRFGVKTPTPYPSPQGGGETRGRALKMREESLQWPQRPSPPLRGRCQRKLTEGGASAPARYRLPVLSRRCIPPSAPCRGHLPLKGGEELVANLASGRGAALWPPRHSISAPSRAGETRGHALKMREESLQWPQRPSPPLRGRCQRKLTEGGSSAPARHRLPVLPRGRIPPSAPCRGHLPLKGGEELVANLASGRGAALWPPRHSISAPSRAGETRGHALKMREESLQWPQRPSPPLRGRCQRKLTEGGSSAPARHRLPVLPRGRIPPSAPCRGHLPLKGGEELVANLASGRGAALWPPRHSISAPSRAGETQGHALKMREESLQWPQRPSPPLRGRCQRKLTEGGSSAPARHRLPVLPRGRIPPSAPCRGHLPLKGGEELVANLASGRGAALWPPRHSISAPSRAGETRGHALKMREESLQWPQRPSPPLRGRCQRKLTEGGGSAPARHRLRFFRDAASPPLPPAGGISPSRGERSWWQTWRPEEGQHFGPQGTASPPPQGQGKREVMH